MSDSSGYLYPNPSNYEQPYTRPHLETIDSILSRREPRPVLQLVCGFLIFAFCQILTQLIFAALVGPLAASKLFDNLATVEYRQGLVLLLCSVGGAVFSVVLFALVVWGLSDRRPFEFNPAGLFTAFPNGLFIGTMMISVVIGIIWVFGGYQVEGFGIHPYVLVAASAGVGAGFMEEIFFRGFMFRIMERWLGSWPAVAFSSILFGLVHIGNVNATLFGALAIGIEAGVLFAGLYMWTRRLWVPVGVHMAWNFVQGGIWSSPISGTGTAEGVVHGKFVGSDLLTGGSMGVEGSVVAVAVCLAIGVFALYRAHVLGRVIVRPTNGWGAIPRP